MKRYLIEFVVSADKLQTILGVLGGEIDKLQIKQVDEVRHSRSPNNGAAPSQDDLGRVVNGKAGQTVVLALSKFSPGQTCKRAAAETLLEKAGYSRTTAGPIFSMLGRGGYLQKTGGRGSDEFKVLKPFAELVK